MIFDAITEAYAELGDPFTSNAYTKWRVDQAARDRAAGVFRELPSYHTIWSRYGTWKNAVWAALRKRDETATADEAAEHSAPASPDEPPTEEAA